MYAKQLWPLLAQALSLAQAGDGALIRAIADEFFYGRDPTTGEYDPGTDRYFTIGASEQRYTRDIGTLPRGRRRRVGRVRPLLLQQRLHRAELRAVSRSTTATPSTGPFRVAALVADAARRRDDVRPGDAVPRRAAARPRPGQRAAADDARRRPHRVRERQPGLHRHRDRGLREHAHAAGAAARVADRTSRSRPLSSYGRGRSRARRSCSGCACTSGRSSADRNDLRRRARPWRVRRRKSTPRRRILVHRLLWRLAPGPVAADTRGAQIRR